VRREGPLLQRVGLRAVRSLGIGTWRLAERIGVDLFGATELPSIPADAARQEVFDELIADARARDGVVDVAACPYPLHELLTHLVVEHRLLLHGSNHRELEVLEPRPARDGATTLRAVVASDDAVWPLFYAVLDRERVPRIFSACTHLGRQPRARRFYLFAIEGSPTAAASWTAGTMYALRRDGFRREWGNEWVSAGAVRPELRVPVEPGDFPLREAVVGLANADEFRHVIRHLRAAKRDPRAG
jgi:hypothetical protein